MKAWEIWSYQPVGWPESHPAVIISSDDRVSNKLDINVLMCSSKQATRPAQPHEVILDQSDGLSWATLCKCDIIHLVSKASLTTYRGKVAFERRRRIIATINRANDWV